MKPFAQEPALTERVRDAILGAIVDGTFRTGDRLRMAIMQAAMEIPPAARKARSNAA